MTYAYWNHLVLKVKYESILEDVFSSAQYWISEDVDNPNPLPPEWQAAKRLADVAPAMYEMLATLRANAENGLQPTEEDWQKVSDILKPKEYMNLEEN